MDFFNKKDCDRCHRELTSRTTSWFTEETICLVCSAKESELRAGLRKEGHIDSFEGCGFIPKLKEEKKND